MCRWLLESSGINPGDIAKLLRADKAGNHPSELARLEGHTELSYLLATAEERNGCD